VGTRALKGKEKGLKKRNKVYTREKEEEYFGLV